ncbi:hypothetical protein J8273_5131 [Carpediemonas membranifera]|uniref:Tyr recombinase domain-containing protein n=1 Tax=Carpediemonas membranifera TaxID=201153 RepID=A0A8J6E2P6_9EUKA|nr:hypothetical protein J8273_5131 [Carpediemonas membranifera]|eukprot:KAG9392152.1 hypothetical protein J8273_5131 [Carpediemonas membranifera]
MTREPDDSDFEAYLGQNDDPAPTPREAAWEIVRQAHEKIHDQKWVQEFEEVAIAGDDDDTLLWYMIGEVPFLAKDSLLTKEANIRDGMTALGEPIECPPLHRALIKACGRLAGRCPTSSQRRTGKAWPIARETLSQAAVQAGKSATPALTQAIAFGLVGFATISRSGEIRGLSTSDVERHGRDITITIRRSKTSDEPMLKLVPNVPGDDNPADWLARHMENLPDEGPLWRSFEARDALIKDNRSSLMNRDHPWRRWEMSMDLEEVLRASGHSFRRGGAVHMMKLGVAPAVIQAIGGWKQLDSMQTYVSEAVRLSTSAWV